MKHLRNVILAFVLMAGFSPAFAQAPAPVPTLPDTERRVSYALTASTCACSIPFAIFGEGTDYANWIEVWVNGTRIDQFGNWTITSPSGSIGTLPRPITNGVLTFNVAQTGTVQIVGARRPRRISQFSESTGVSARNLNQVFTDIIAQNRETWDKINDVTGRVIMAPPGESLSVLASAASRANSVLGFDALGNIKTYNPASAVTGSENVNFLQAGTGAVSRTVQEELRDTVKAAQFGAVCDGVTDDAPAVLRAVNLAKSLRSPSVELPEGTCVFNSTVYQNEWAAAGVLTVPGLHIKGQGKGVTTIDTRVANGYAIAVNPAWHAAFQALDSITSSAAGGSLTSSATYYVQITVTDPLGNEIYVTLPKSIVLGGSDNRITVALPASNTGYTYNIYLSLSSTPANYASVSGVDAVGVFGNQTIPLTAVGTAHAVPTDKRAVWQQANIHDLSITNTTGAVNASGVLYFKVGFANLTNVLMNGLTGSGFVVPNFAGDIDGSFVFAVDRSKFDTIAGWCMDVAGRALENSYFSAEKISLNLCGTAPTNLNTPLTISAITNSTLPLVTIAAAHGWVENDQILIGSVAGMSLPAGWYRVGPVLSTTTFNLKTLEGAYVDTTSLGAYTASSGNGRLSWRPPTATTGSGGIRYMGLISNFKDVGCTQVNNVCIYFTEQGTSDAATLQGIDAENTAGKGIYIASLAGGSLTNSECLSATGLGNTISCLQLGTGFAAGGVRDFKVQNLKVRNTVIPAAGFEQFPNTNITTYAETNRISNVNWQTFDSSNTRYRGFQFEGISGLAQFSISAANTAKLIPTGFGATMPMKLAGTGEWIEFHVPASGITQTGIGGLSAATSYNFYLYNSAAVGLPVVGAIEVATAVPILDAEGYKVKTGDSTRAFIGSATTDGAGNFQTTSVQSSFYPPGGGASIGIGATNQVAFFSAASTINGLATCNSGAIVTSAGGVPSCATTLPNMAHGIPTSITLTNATGLPISTGLTGAGTGVLAALAINIGTAGSPVTNGGALGSPSSAGTLPAFTLGGTISGGGNQINNVIVGTSTPLAGFFTTLSATTSITSPLHLGGTAVGSSLTLQSTSGNGTTDFINAKVGNNGAVESWRALSNGNFGVNTLTPQSAFVVGGAGGANAGLEIAPGASISLAAYNRNTSAYATANFDAAAFNFRPGGTQMFATGAAGILFTSAGKLIWGATAPTVGSGFCTTPSISNSNGTAAFTIAIGSACAASTGVLTMPAATTGWKCDFSNVTNPAANKPDQTASTTTSVSVTNYVRTTGVAGNWTASDVIAASCTGY